jgi:hypothetical protein
MIKIRCELVFKIESECLLEITSVDESCCCAVCISHGFACCFEVDGSFVSCRDFFQSCWKLPFLPRKCTRFLRKNKDSFASRREVCENREASKQDFERIFASSRDSMAEKTQASGKLPM